MGVVWEFIKTLKLILNFYIMYQKQFTDTLQKVEKKENDVLAMQSQDIITKSNTMLLFLSDVLNKIKAKIIKKDFQSEHEEIYFFKEVKPQILGKILFYQKLIDVEVLCSKSNLKQQVKYYKVQINTISKDFNDEFYRYILLNRVDKDNFYFLRKNINYNELKTIHKDFFLS